MLINRHIFFFLLCFYFDDIFKFYVSFASDSIYLYITNIDVLFVNAALDRSLLHQCDRVYSNTTPYTHKNICMLTRPGTKMQQIIWHKTIFAIEQKNLLRFLSASQTSFQCQILQLLLINFEEEIFLRWKQIEQEYLCYPYDKQRR